MMNISGLLTDSSHVGCNHATYLFWQFFSCMKSLLDLVQNHQTTVDEPQLITTLYPYN